MMNTKGVIAIVAILVVAAVGGYWFLTSEAGGWTAPWGATSQGVTGTWFVEPYITYADGSIEHLSVGSQALWMKHEGVQVTSITYELKAQATRDNNQGTFESVELDINNLKLNAKFTRDFGLQFYANAWEDFSGIVTIPFSGSTTTDKVTVASFTLPTTIDGSNTYANGINTGPIPTLPCTTMNEMTAQWQTGLYEMFYTAEGSVLFRGTSSDFGDSDWANAALPGSVLHFVDIGNYVVNMDWNSEISYS